jgi:hypothetical protein
MAISNFIHRVHLEKPENYEFPGFADFKFTAGMTVVFACLEVFM